MKKIFTILFLVAVTAVSAQSLKIHYNGSPLQNNDTIDIPVVVGSDVNNFFGYQNTVEEGIFFKVKKEELQLVTGAAATFCIGGTCYSGNVSQENFIDEGSTVDAENETYALHTTFLSPASGVSLVKYTLYNTDNQNDAVSVVLRYTAGTGLADVKAPAKINAYPNPATTNLTVEYDAAQMNNPRFVIRNLTGAVVYSTTLDSSRGVLELSDLSLKSGIYFYGIVSDNKTVVAKKLVVK